MINLTQFLAVIWTLYGINFICTVCRVVLRWRVQGKYVLEDIFAFAGFIILTGLTAVVTVAAPKFYMVRSYMIEATDNPLSPPPVPLDELTAQTALALKLMFAQMLLFWSTLWAGKFSLLVFFRRMVLGLPKYLNIFWVVFGLVLITYLGCMASNFLTCKPLHKYWSSTGCSDPANVERADKSIKFATGADISADFLIMLLPLKLLWNLHISRRQKIGLACMFSLGAIVIVFAFIRLHNVTKATQDQDKDMSKMTEGPLLLALWSQIEASVAIIVANLPAFRSLLRTRGTTTHASKTYRGSSYPTRSSGTHPSARKNNISIEQSSVQHIRSHNSLEMQSLQSEDTSSAHNGREDGSASRNGVMRTTEFEIHSAHMPAAQQDHSHHIRPFATNN